MKTDTPTNTCAQLFTAGHSTTAPPKSGETTHLFINKRMNEQNVVYFSPHQHTPSAEHQPGGAAGEDGSGKRKHREAGPCPGEMAAPANPHPGRRRDPAVRHGVGKT